MISREICSGEEWEELMCRHFTCHLLQSRQWADFKSNSDWQPFFLMWKDEEKTLLGGASVLCKTSYVPLLKIPIRIMYVPRGPVLNWENAETAKIILKDLTVFAKEEGATYIKIDPEVFYKIEGPQEFVVATVGDEINQLFTSLDWKYAKEQIQFKNTFWLSLHADDDQLLGNMKQKTRYNVRLATKKGVTVRKAAPEDFHLLYNMYAETSKRDGFIIRSEDYYLDLWNRLYQADMAFGLIAEFEGVPLAGLMNFVYQHRAWYFYGMSTTEHRNYMPTYILQWEAMKMAKASGCTLYDMWGAPDEIDENDSMYGVFRFKQGLGASFVEGVGAWDFVIKPVWYQIISLVLPKVLDIMRFLRRREINQEVMDA